MADLEALREQTDQMIVLLENMLGVLREIQQELRTIYFTSEPEGSQSLVGLAQVDVELQERIALAKRWVLPRVTLGLQPRVNRLLDARGVQTIGQLVLFDWVALQSLTGIGSVTVWHIKRALEREGLSLASRLEAEALSTAFDGLDFPFITVLVLHDVHNLTQLGFKTRQWVDELLSGYPNATRRDSIRKEIDLRLEKIGRRLG